MKKGYDGWWNYVSETEYKTCPECCGTGKDNSSLDHKCYYCNGTGRIKIEKDKGE